MSEAMKIIERELNELADEAFDPENDLDSNGYDQGERNGILKALDRVRNILENNG